MSDFEVLRQLAAVAALSEDEVDQARQLSDYSEGDPESLEARKPSHVAPQLTDEEMQALISEEARLKVIEFEVTSEKAFRKKYEQPILPGVSSGVTIGIGYDLGYRDPDDVQRDFQDLIPQADIDALVPLCRLIGNRARSHFATVRHIRVPRLAGNTKPS